MPSLRALREATLPSSSDGHAGQYDALVQLNAHGIRRVVSALLPRSYLKKRVEEGVRQAPPRFRTSLIDNQLDEVDFYAGDFSVHLDPANRSVQVALDFTAFFPNAGADPLRGTLTFAVGIEVDTSDSAQIVVRLSQVGLDRIEFRFDSNAWLTTKRREILQLGFTVSIVEELTRAGDKNVGPKLASLPLHGELIEDAYIDAIATDNEETSVLSLAVALHDYLDLNVVDLKRDAEIKLRHSLAGEVGFSTGQSFEPLAAGSTVKCVEVTITELSSVTVSDDLNTETVNFKASFRALASFKFRLAGGQSWSYQTEFTFSQQSKLEVHNGKLVARWDPAAAKSKFSPSSGLDQAQATALKEGRKFASSIMISGFRPHEWDVVKLERSIVRADYVVNHPIGRMVMRMFLARSTPLGPPNLSNNFAKARLAEFSVPPGMVHGSVPPLAQDVVVVLEERMLAALTYDVIFYRINFQLMLEQWGKDKVLGRTYLGDEVLAVSRYALSMVSGRVDVDMKVRLLESGETASAKGSIDIKYLPYRYRQHFDVRSRFVFDHPAIKSAWGLAIMALLVLPFAGFGAGVLAFPAAAHEINRGVQDAQMEIDGNILRALNEAKDEVESLAFELESNRLNGRLKVNDIEVERGIVMRLNLDIWQERPEGMRLIGRRFERINGRWILFAYQLENGALIRISHIIREMEAGDTVAGVHLVRRGSHIWLRSNPDSSRSNNLSTLPEV